MKKIGTSDMLKGKIGLGNIGGSTHRAYTMGHDPVWGWIFGNINIMTRSITLKNPEIPVASLVRTPPKRMAATMIKYAPQLLVARTFPMSSTGSPLIRMAARQAAINIARP